MYVIAGGLDPRGRTPVVENTGTIHPFHRSSWRLPGGDFHHNPSTRGERRPVRNPLVTRPGTPGS